MKDKSSTGAPPEEGLPARRRPEGELAVRTVNVAGFFAGIIVAEHSAADSLHNVVPPTLHLGTLALEFPSYPTVCVVILVWSPDVRRKHS